MPPFIRHLTQRKRLNKRRKAHVVLAIIFLVLIFKNSSQKQNSLSRKIHPNNPSDSKQLSLTLNVNGVLFVLTMGFNSLYVSVILTYQAL